MGVVATEHLAGVVLSGRPDVAALGVEDECHVGVRAADVRTQRLERGSSRCEAKYAIWGLNAHTRSAVASTISLQKRNTASWPRSSGAGKRRRIGIEPDAQQRAAGGPRPRQLRVETHGRRDSAQGLAVVADERDRTGGTEVLGFGGLGLQFGGTSSMNRYRNPSARISNTSGHTCTHVPVEAHTS